MGGIIRRVRNEEGKGEEVIHKFKTSNLQGGMGKGEEEWERD
jgi:hypothetical protein